MLMLCHHHNRKVTFESEGKLRFAFDDWFLESTEFEWLKSGLALDKKYLMVDVVEGKGTIKVICGRNGCIISPSDNYQVVGKEIFSFADTGVFRTTISIEPTRSSIHSILRLQYDRESKYFFVGTEPVGLDTEGLFMFGFPGSQSTRSLDKYAGFKIVSFWAPIDMANLIFYYDSLIGAFRIQDSITGDTISAAYLLHSRMFPIRNHFLLRFEPTND